MQRRIDDFHSYSSGRSPGRLMPSRRASAQAAVRSATTDRRAEYGPGVGLVHSEPAAQSGTWGSLSHLGLYASSGIRQWSRLLRGKVRLNPKRLTVAVLVAALPLIVISTVVLRPWLASRRYSLSSASLSLIGAPDRTLAAKLSYDKANATFYLNRNAATTSTPSLLTNPALANPVVAGQRSGGYSLKLPSHLAAGMTVYDQTTNLFLTLDPELTTMPGRDIGGHLVYPIAGGGQDIYTVKRNGVEEDLVFAHAPAGSMTVRYRLRLPSSTVARQLPSGAIGIYSSSPGSSTGSSKDYMVFALVAPVVVTKPGASHNPEGVSTKLSLAGDQLSVNVTGLSRVHGLFSIDPSVVVPSALSFATGNNEGDISYGPNGTSISEAGLDGGSLSQGWTATTSLPTGTDDATSVAYNGYVYEIGGYNGNIVATVDYAPINANGTLGSWTATTSLPTATDFATSVAYNGYVYEIGGCASTCPTATVDYAAINSNGALGSWTATTSLPAATENATSVAYNGYVYEIGGDASGITATVDYAPINANGTLGSWTATTSLLTATYLATSVAYNGYVYEIGGALSGVAIATVDYAPINANGTLGAWTATTSLPAATYVATSVAYNGYVYEIGGDASGITGIVDYATINSNGTLRSWTATTSLPATKNATSVAYNGYVYEIGGYNVSIFATVYYAPIDPAGVIGGWGATGSLPAATAGATSVAYNGYVYEIGGYTSAATTTVDYAPINSNGTLGSWTATTSLPTATYAATSVAYNGYVYEIGGYTGSGITATVDYAPINSNGTLGSWTATTSLPTATRLATSVAYNGYVYEIGGSAAGTPATVDYAPINSNGTLGSWSATTSLPTATYAATSVAYNGYVYEIGGYTSAATATVDYAPINANGTLGSWSATTSLPTATYYATSVAYNGYVYEIGGYYGSSDFATVDYAPINSNGTLGSWTATTSLPTATRLATSVAYNGYVYEIGGYTGSGITATVDYAPINSNGTLGSWTATTSLPTATHFATSVAYNGYVYEIGGCASTCPTATVDYASLQSIPRVGQYSMLVDLSGSPIEDPTPIELLSNLGNTGNPGIPGQVAGAGLGGVTVQYKFASNSCTTFNNPNLISAGPSFATPQKFSYTTDGCGNSTSQARYVWLRFTIDDSQTATFPDINGNHTTITRMELYYHPAANGRLHGGATFSNGSLQSLDAPPTPGTL